MLKKFDLFGDFKTNKNIESNKKKIIEIGVKDKPKVVISSSAQKAIK